MTTPEDVDPDELTMDDLNELDIEAPVEDAMEQATAVTPVISRVDFSRRIEVDEYDADGRGSWRSVIAQGVYEELAGDDVPAALDLLRERFARASGREAPARPLGDGVVVFRVRLGETTGRTVER